MKVFFVPVQVALALLCESPKWIGRKYKDLTLVYMGGEWTADCRLSDPNITVELRGANDFINLSHWSEKKHVRQNAQNITLYNLPLRFSGTYCCNAKGAVSIKKCCLTKIEVLPYKGKHVIHEMIYTLT